MTDDIKKPGCYGVLAKVFPMGGEGLRHSPEECLACPHKTPCLRAALSSDPAADHVREERMDRAYASGNLSFIERWSRKKAMAGKKGRAEKKGRE
ncbi:hypothetical protein [Desulfoluna sp.]|uniref:hypothetical protein n=1 Tax=Desulfoluna sp. TaxID=2045199 RepID=UPI0026052595|nr:hypothetical protein [Desulfoluna sp.]